MPADTITLSINGMDVTVPQGSTVMDAAKKLSIEVPHFCFHERLSVAGNCRMCLVEVEGAPKPVASCHWPAADGMVVRTNSDTAVKAQKGTMEFLLINHPLDCPICDQGGECDLQDVALGYGSDRTHYCEGKRAVEDKDIGSKIKTVMTRCIHCTRCIRFATEIAGVEEFGATGRGEQMKVGTYVEKALVSELAGNMIDLCPVGALTSKPYAFTARPWELEHTDSIDVFDACGTNIRIDHRDGKVMRVLPRENNAINEEWMTDTARFSWDGLTENRLTHPQMNGKVVGWPKAFEEIAKKLKGKKAVAGVAGNLHSAEDLFSFKALMERLKGKVYADVPKVAKGAGRGAYTLNMPLEKLEEADAVLLVGCNPRFEAPMVNLRLRKAVAKGAKVALVGADTDLTYPHLWLGDTPTALENMLETHKGIKATKPLILIGQDVLNRKDGNAIVALCHQLAGLSKLAEGWQPVHVLPRHTSTVPALDMGYASSADIKPAEALFIYGEGSVDEEAFKKAKLKVYIGTHKTDLAKQCDVVLPAAAFTEKAGCWVNMEGRVQEGGAAVLPPMNAKEDWKIFRALSDVLKCTLPFDTLAQLREGVATVHPAYQKTGEVIAEEWSLPGKAGKLLKSAFKALVVADGFYLSNEILQASPTMHKMQAEFDQAQKNKNMKKAS